MIEFFEQKATGFFKENESVFNSKLSRFFEQAHFLNDSISKNQLSVFRNKKSTSLSFQNMKLRFNQLQIFEMSPFLHFNFENDWLEKTIQLFNNDFLFYYKNQIPHQNKFRMYWNDKLRSLITELIKTNQLEVFFSKHQLISEVFCVILRRHFGFKYSVFDFKNSTVKESKRTRPNIASFYESDFKKFKLHQEFGTTREHSKKFNFNDFE